jgi:hypothetical protein
MTSTQTPKWNRESITALLARNDQAVERAMLVLFDRQTADEQMTDATRKQNGRGFTAFNAEIFSSFAKQVHQGRTLSPKQLALARKPDKFGNPRIARYWSQLLEAIEDKQATATARVQ